MINYKITILVIISCFIIIQPIMAQKHKNHPRNHIRWVSLNNMSKAISDTQIGYAKHRKKTKLVNIKEYSQKLKNHLNKELSQYCSIGQFNQKKHGKYYAIIKTDNETTKFAMSKIAWNNITDLNKKAKKDYFYLFKFDGTSNCLVYSIKD